MELDTDAMADVVKAELEWPGCEHCGRFVFAGMCCAEAERASREALEAARRLKQSERDMARHARKLACEARRVAELQDDAEAARREAWERGVE